MTSILSTAPASESDNSPDPQQFTSWKGKGGAETLLPDVEKGNSK